MFKFKRKDKKEKKLKKSKNKMNHNENYENQEFLDANNQNLFDNNQQELNIQNVSNPQDEDGEMVFSQEYLADNNLYKDALYTKQDLKNFNLSENDVTKFFKNGSVYYKLKDPVNNVKAPKSIFKNDTKFSLNTLGNMVENDPFFKDVKYYKEFDISSLLPDDPNINPQLQEKIFQLNRSLENQLKNIEEYSVNENELDSIIKAQKDILETQMEIQNKIYNLKQDYANSDVFFRISNLSFNTWNEDDIYFGYKLNNITFDIYATNKIVVISDNSITNQLLIDVLRGDEVKSGGYIYKNLHREQKWIDVDDINFNQYKVNGMDLGEEIYYGLTSPDYLSFGAKKKDTVGITMNKIFKTLSVNVDENFKNKLIKLMNFQDYITQNVFELDDLNLEKFVTICDILIGKKILLIKSICQGMSYNQKIELFKFLNDYFDAKKITVIYASDDYLEANLLASKVMLIKNGCLVGFEDVNNLLTSFNSIDDYILYTLKYAPTFQKND